MAVVADHQRLADWFDAVCSDVHGRLEASTEGEPASYIPELACVDPDRFGIAAMTVDGQPTLVGDHDHAFTIQSISKLLLYGLALETHGRDAVLARAGVAPTGDPFNAIELDDAENRAPNPMVNSGAIAVADMVPGNGLEERTEAVLAMFGATIANNGVHPTSGARVVSPKVARDMLTVALTCGMYDDAGEWAYTVGIPAKSGVGGGIVGMIPGVGGLAVYSPRLDQHGNSVRGIRTFEELSQEFDLHVFDVDRPWSGRD